MKPIQQIAGTISKQGNFFAFLTRIADYGQLIKFKLTLMVIFSAGIGFVLAQPVFIFSEQLLLLLLSGFFITGSANGINQIIERNFDKLMPRTFNRPVASNRISKIEAMAITFIMGVSGTALLALYFNKISALIGIGSLIIYAFVYTPLKRITPLSVVAGAIAGAAPPLIGYTAVTGSLDSMGILLFVLQFIWQLPHFWAIAWVLNDEYKKAGFFLLPSKSGRDDKTAYYIFISTLGLIIFSILIIILGYIDLIAGALILLLSVHFTYQAFRLVVSKNMKDAKQLMFGSFYYLPMVQLLLIFGSFF